MDSSDQTLYVSSTVKSVIKVKTKNINKTSRNGLQWFPDCIAWQTSLPLQTSSWREYDKAYKDI